jgi:hypothetical protein
VRLVEEPGLSSPKASILRNGTSTILGIAARDYRGLAATISGALWHQNIDLRQAHLFSAMHHCLALDFFHLAPQERLSMPEVPRFVEDAIRRRLFIADSDEDGLPHIAGSASLQEWRHGLHCLRFETSEAANGLIYMLTYKIFRHLHGDIFGLSAQAAHGRAYVSVYHRLPRELSLTQAQDITTRHF